jgi:hypothetical protein
MTLVAEQDVILCNHASILDPTFLVKKSQKRFSHCRPQKVSEFTPVLEKTRIRATIGTVPGRGYLILILVVLFYYKKIVNKCTVLPVNPKNRS